MTTESNAKQPNLTVVKNDETTQTSVAMPTDDQLIELAKKLYEMDFTVEELNSPEAAPTREMLVKIFIKREGERLAKEQEQQKAEQSAALKQKLSGLNAALHRELNPPKGPSIFLSEEQIEERRLAGLPKHVRVLEEYSKSHKGHVPEFILVADPGRVFDKATVWVSSQKVRVEFKQNSDLLMAYRGWVCFEHKNVLEQVEKMKDPADRSALETHAHSIAGHIRLVSEIAAKAFDINFNSKQVSKFDAPFPVFKFIQNIVKGNTFCQQFFARPAIGEARVKIELEQAAKAEEEKKAAAESVAKAEENRKAEEILRREIGGLLVGAGCEDKDFLMKAVTRLVKKFDGTAEERLRKAAIGQAILSRTAPNDEERSATERIANLYAKAASLSPEELTILVEDEMKQHHSPVGKKTPEVERQKSASQQKRESEQRRSERNKKKNAQQGKGKNKKQ